MKRTYLILLVTIFYNLTFGQNIAFMKLSDNYLYLTNAIIEALNKSGLNVKQFSNDNLFEKQYNKITQLTSAQLEILKMFNHDYIILHKSEKAGQFNHNISGKDNLNSEINWQSEFLVFNVNTNQSTIVSLAISTYDCGNTLGPCSNIGKFVKEVNDFVKAIPSQSTKQNNSQANSLIKKPSLMVLPNKINQSKWQNGEYQLNKIEKMLIAALKNKFEENKFTTFGFESVLKRVIENRQANDSVRNDVKSKILEVSGIDFFVEFENLDETSKDCNKVFDFKIRNYSTGEDVASDIRNLNSCGTPDEYKNFAGAVLNQGAIEKINDQFSTVINNGRKVIIIFTIANTSKARFNLECKGKKLGIHINECLQKLAFKGNLELEEESDLRKQAIVNIPLIDEKNGQRYQTTTFTEEVLSYLKANADVDCDRVVSRQVINIKIK